MNHPSEVPDAVHRAFGLSERPVLLPGGERRTFRAGGAVLRHENAEELPDARFSAGLFARIAPSDEFRVPQPIRARAGDWIADGAWSAWTFVEGRPAGPADAPAIVRAVGAFHRAIAGEPQAEYLRTRSLIYDRADRGTFGELPPDIGPSLRPTIAALCGLRRPIHELPEQLIHGDANAANVLIADGMAPAIIDFSPYWRPPQFALAVTAFWMCAYEGHTEAFAAFERVRAFDQLLLRALIRSLLVADGFGQRDVVAEYRGAIALVTARLDARR